MLLYNVFFRDRLRIFLIVGSLIVLLSLISYWVFSEKDSDIIAIDPAFGKYITGFTSGVVSKTSTVRIRLASPVQKAEANTPVSKTLFDFDPDISGQAYWLDKQTIEFRPDEQLPSGESFHTEFYLYKLLEVPEKLETFAFRFKIIKQTFEVQIDGLKAFDHQTLEWQKLHGQLLTADADESEEIEQILNAHQEDRSLPIHWQHNEEKTRHTFTIDSISRKEEEQEVIISWNGEPINVDLSGNDTVKIPALGDFKVTDIDVVQEPEQYVLLRFSDPLDKDQNLEGLVRIGDLRDIRTVIEDNELRIYPPSRQMGTKTIYLAPGLKNVLDYPLENGSQYEVTFESIKPAVRLVGKGVILPSSEQLIFPFEAVNLKAVDVSIIKIYQKNIPQFLQINDLEEDDELRRVGQVVLRKTVRLDNNKLLDLGKWNRFTLDLNNFIQQQTGDIYRVMLTFRKSYSLYHCDGEAAKEDEDLQTIDNNWENRSKEQFWSYYDDWYPYGYGWRHRDDPCHYAYYNKRKWVSRNVLASDLGLIGKRGQTGEHFFAVTDLQTTEPVAGATLEIYDYQQQLIKKVSTGDQGMATVKLEEEPFLLVAKKGQQRGYMKLDDGSSLSLSRFDVSGREVQEGVKGFIYGERGVWRPGDSLYVTFILEDKKNLLPDDHPVILEFYNPLNQLVEKQIKTEGVHDFYTFRLGTEPSAPTGNWTANVSVGGATFRKRLKIETIKPNRLKINLDFEDQTLTKNELLQGTLKSEWLHGATAKNLKAKVDVNVTEAVTAFKGYENYTFDDPTRDFRSISRTIFEGKLNSKGTAQLNTRFTTDDEAPGRLHANFVMKVFEPGGNFSIDRKSMNYHPFDSYVGIKLPETKDSWGRYYLDSSYTFNFAAVNPEGNPVSGRSLEANIYKLEWRWWWQQANRDLTNFNRSTFKKPVKTGTVTTRNGKASWTTSLNSGWGRYLIRVCDQDGEHCTGKVVYFSSPYWSSRYRGQQPEGAAMLAFSADKEKYEVGDEATLTIPSSAGGRALVSIESGSGIIQTDWVQTQQGKTMYTFDITEEMTPNIYAHVTLLQPHAQTKNDLPIRLYGVIPIRVEDETTHLYPQLSMPDVLQPEQEVQLTVGEKNDRAMTYTVAMVDEGLLDLTHFATPDPWEHFYAREALGVKTWDIFEYVLGAYGGELERLLSLGGGMAPRPEGGKKANRFKPMVRFLGPFHLEAGEQRTHKIQMPRYIGSVRTMVVAGEEAAYGSTDKTTPVRKPLMVLGSLPRVLGPEEQVKLPVTIFAMEEQVKDVQVTVQTNHMLSTQSASAAKSVRFNQPGEKTVYFDLNVARKLGIGKVKITARSGNEKATYGIELDVRNPNPEVTTVMNKVLQPGQSWETDYEPVGMAGTNKGVLEVSNIPPLNLEQRLRYLIRYPHGCVEQVTSSVFPQLFLTDLLDLSNHREEKIKSNIEAGIEKLRRYQQPGGGFGYWPGNEQADNWATSYAGHFLVEAKRKGYTLPPGCLSAWKDYQRNEANHWSAGHHRSELSQAYRLYTLALANDPALGAMNRLRRRDGLSTASKWRLAAAYQLAGQPEAARDIIHDIPTNIPEYRELGYTYGSDLRDEAMILETLGLMNKKEKGGPLLKNISDRLGADRWLSTQTTAYCLLAVAKFVGKTGLSKPGHFVYQIDRQNRQQVSMQAPIAQRDLEISGAQSGQVEVTNKGESMLFARVVLQGIPVSGQETASANGLQMEINYALLDGTPIGPSRIEQGTDFKATVTVYNSGYRGDYKELALEQIFPSGWEIHNTRMYGETADINNSRYNYRDIRDDRVYTYFDLDKHKKKTFTVLLNASFLGKYYLPAINTEAMYDATIHARKPGRWVRVVPPGEGMMN